MAYARFENGVITYVEGNVIRLDGKYVICPSDEVRAKAGIYPVENIAEDGTDELVDNVIKHYTGGRTLAQAKAEKIAEINAYDSSDSVNGFSFNGDTMWFDKATRVGLMNSTTILKNAGEENCTLWGYSQSHTIPCDTLIAMLSQLEVYALNCYNVTQQHIQAVNALTTIDEVDAYDVADGYPEQISFTL